VSAAHELEAAYVPRSLPVASRDAGVSLLGVYLAVLLLIPVDLYRLPLSLPFDLEPQRVVLFGVAAVWSAALLVDARVRIREMGLGRPWILLVGTAVLSMVANAGSITPAEGMQPVKALLVMLSWLLVCVFAASAVPDEPSAERLTGWIALLGVFLGFCALVERTTTVNVFRQLDHVLPFLKSTGARVALYRGGGVRVSGSAENSIAFGAILVLISPFVAHKLHRATSPRARIGWGAGLVVLVLGALVTGSRTALLGIAVATAVFAVLQPRVRAKIVPLALAVLLVTHMAFPGLLSSFRHVLSADYLVGREFTSERNIGRGRAFPVVLASVRDHPLLGVGFRRFDPEVYEFTDNQYLKQLAELGMLGLAALVWLIGATTVIPGRASARASPGLCGLLAAFAASSAAFAAMAVAFDTLGFPQAPYLFFALAGAGCGVSRTVMHARRCEAPRRTRYGS
jgi:O-antigen ligase